MRNISRRCKTSVFIHSSPWPPVLTCTTLKQSVSYKQKQYVAQQQISGLETFKNKTWGRNNLESPSPTCWCRSEESEGFSKEVSQQELQIRRVPSSPHCVLAPHNTGGSCYCIFLGSDDVKDKAFPPPLQLSGFQGSSACGHQFPAKDNYILSKFSVHFWWANKDNISACP